MVTTLTLRTTGFRAMCQELARMSGKEYRAVLGSEAATCVKMAALQSAIASAAQIKKQVEEREGHKWQTANGEYSVNVRSDAGRVWFWDKDRGIDRGVRAHGPLQPGQTRQIVQHGGFYMIYDTGRARGHHVPDRIWQGYLDTRYGHAEAVKLRTKEILRRRGMERLSWLQIGDALGVSLATVAPARNLREDIARGSKANGRTYANGSATEGTSALRFQITVENQSPIAVKRWGRKRIEDAMQRRRRGFEIAMKKGLFENLTLRAKRYPGIFVKEAA